MREWFFLLCPFSIPLRYWKGITRGSNMPMNWASLLIHGKSNMWRQQQVCDYEWWCNPKPLAWTLALTGSFERLAISTTDPDETLIGPLLMFFLSFSLVLKRNHLPLSLSHAGHTVKSSGHISKLPTCILRRLVPLQTAVCIIRLERRRGKKIPSGYFHVAFITSQTVHSKWHGDLEGRLLDCNDKYKNQYINHLGTEEATCGLCVWGKEEFLKEFQSHHLGVSVGVQREFQFQSCLTLAWRLVIALTRQLLFSAELLGSLQPDCSIFLCPCLLGLSFASVLVTSQTALISQLHGRTPSSDIVAQHSVCHDRSQGVQNNQKKWRLYGIFLMCPLKKNDPRLKKEKKKETRLFALSSLSIT